MWRPTPEAQASLHTLVEKEHLCTTLPHDGAPNTSILQQVASVNKQRDVNLRNTIFVREVVYRPESATVARVQKLGRVMLVAGHDCPCNISCSILLA